MNLFEINDAIQRCVKLESGTIVDMETGEVIDTEALDQLVMDRDTKIRNIACWIRNLESDEKQLEEQEHIFRDRKNAAKRKKESLKSYLAAFLNGAKWKNKEVSISWRKSDPVVITDITKISKYYLKERRLTEDDFNKTLIKSDLKNGLTIDGAQIVSKNNIQIK